MNVKIVEEIKKRLKPRSVLALTLESGRLVVNHVLAGGEGGGVSQTLSIPAGAEEVFKDPEKAGAQLASALEAAGIRQRRCVVCVPAGWALSASTELPDVSAEDLQGFIELRAEREFPVAVSELRIAHCPWSLPDGERRTTLAAVPVKRMDAIDRMLAAAGCRAVSVSLALGECLMEPKPALHFIANGTHTDVIVTAGGGVVSMRSLGGPGPDDETPFDPAVFYREVRITLGRLPETIRREVRQAHFSGSPVSAQRLFDKTRDQLRNLGLESIESAATRGTGQPQAVTDPAVKAAELYLREKPVAFEFFVPEVNRWQAMALRYDTQRHRRIAAVAVSVIFLPVLVFFVRARWEDHLLAEWNGMKKNAGELDALQQKIHKFRPWFEPTPQVLQTLNNLIAAFPEQGDVWAKSLQFAEGNKVSCTGFARNQPALLALLDHLRARPDVSGLQVQQLRGDSPIQFSFTFKWEPGS
jgi:hypothetical protein